MKGPTCDRCHVELDEPGALVFSPPIRSTVTKLHVCVDCFRLLMVWMGLMPWPSASPEGGEG